MAARRGVRMNKRARELIAELRSTGHDARLAGTHGTIRFDVRNEGTWRLRIDVGTVTVLEGPGDADLLLACDEPDFVEVVEGRQNFVTAILQGRIEATGNLSLALRYHGSLARTQPNPGQPGEVRR